MVHPPEVHSLAASRKQQGVEIKLDRVDSYEPVWRAGYRITSSPNAEQGIGRLSVGSQQDPRSAEQWRSPPERTSDLLKTSDRITVE